MSQAKTVILFIFLLAAVPAMSSTWERLYSMHSTDCFRNVKETSNGDFILAGYTADFNGHDTDGIVMRLDDTGDTIWTFTYNGPNSHEDCFYKINQTSDGGFIVCGYSKSFGSSENAIYLKLNSSGALQWIKNWGGSGIERAQDVIEDANGDFIIVGYTTSSPAQYYDAFILKVNDHGTTQWSKIYGWNNYDDANSLRLLPDGGFIIGGQSDGDLFLMRTDQNGDTLWTKVFGTSGTDNIECVNFAQGGDGYILAGGTDGPGNGGDNGYVVRVDTGGNVLWTKTFGGNDNDDFHRIEKTSDGGYVATGTSTDGPWVNPNMWIVKMDDTGQMDWERYYGGDHHDHGYGGQQTSDGGYILAGHSRSFGAAAFLEDAFVVKMNSSGQVINTLDYTTITDLIAPTSGDCGNASTTIKVEVTNYGEATVNNVPVTVEITGPINQTLTDSYTSTINRDESKTLIFTTTADFSAGGTYHFHCYTGGPHDVFPARNYFDKDVTFSVSSATPVVTNGTHCGPASVHLSATSPDPVKWYLTPAGGTSINSGTSFNTPYITTSTTYYVQAGTTCLSSRLPVIAAITTGLTPPVTSDQSRCGDGSVTLSASSGNSIKWYDSPTSNVFVGSGSSFVTPVLQNTFTYYVGAENSTCTSMRVPVAAIVDPMPTDPIVADSSICGNGTVILNASGASTIQWFDLANGGSLLATGNSFTTPLLTQSTSYYVQSFDGTCSSNRIPVNAVIHALPVVNIGPDTIISPAATIDLDAGAGFATYSWTNSSSSEILTVSVDGNYCVTVTDTNNCSATDCSFVQFTVGVAELNKHALKIFPNPGIGILHIELPDESPASLKLYSADGKLIDNQFIRHRSAIVDYSYLNPGIYFIRSTNDYSDSFSVVLIDNR
jgi:hypothetical protein